MKTVLEGRPSFYHNFFDTKTGSTENLDFLVMFQGQEFIIQISRYLFLPSFDIQDSASIGSTGNIYLHKSAVPKT